jgi:hypothetical protein
MPLCMAHHAVVHHQLRAGARWTQQLRKKCQGTHSPACPLLMMYRQNSTWAHSVQKYMEYSCIAGRKAAAFWISAFPESRLRSRADNTAGMSRHCSQGSRQCDLRVRGQHSCSAWASQHFHPQTHHPLKPRVHSCLASSQPHSRQVSPQTFSPWLMNRRSQTPNPAPSVCLAPPD